MLHGVRYGFCLILNICMFPSLPETNKLDWLETIPPDKEQWKRETYMGHKFAIASSERNNE